jgi:urea transport system substrate-binding protein
MVLSYDGVYLWKAAVEKAKSFDVDKVREALEAGVEFIGPGGKVTMQKNHHVTKNVYIGETKADGQFKIVKTFDNVFGEPFLKGTFMKKTASAQ